MIAFLVGFAVLILMVTYWYLFPAMSAARHARPEQKQQLVATARLMLSVVLVLLVAGLLLAFRVGRFFLPRRRYPAAPTPHVDAWAEAGKRLKIPPS